MRTRKVLLSFILAFALIPVIDPARILFLFPLSCRSELNAIHPLATQLLSKGHQITWVTSAKTGVKHPNYIEVIPISVPTKVVDYQGMQTNLCTAFVLQPKFEYQFQGTETSTILEHRARYNKLLPFFLEWNLDSQTRRCNAIYRHPDFRNEVLPPSAEFDLVFINGNLHHCLFGVIPALGHGSHPPPPFIVFTSIPFTGEEFRFPGFRMPSSFVPSSNLGLTGVMNFPQRLLNFIIRMTFSLLCLNYIEFRGESIYKSHLITDNQTELPSISEISENVELIFSNSHPAITNPRPLTPDIVEVGCLQCKEQGRPLPPKLEKWMQGQKGVILFSMGSMFSFSSFPEHLKSVVMSVFGRLSQGVILVADRDCLGNFTTPQNVLVTPWVPQQDLLGDERVKLFISHGGIQSHLEAAWHGVTVLYLPIWADQALAAAHVLENGNGIALEILELTEESFETGITRVLTDTR